MDKQKQSNIQNPVHVSASQWWKVIVRGPLSNKSIQGDAAGSSSSLVEHDLINLGQQPRSPPANHV